ncbi:MAG TPA: hypothetical protein VEA99_06605 [Gemmatimonadaceae bacterium]|nr:hypothetical protein [Gemmatimonadaceae bacterium]
MSIAFLRRLALTTAVALTAGVVGAQPALAQRATANAPDAVAPITTAPTLENSRVAARPLASADSKTVAPAAMAQGVGRPVALMLVGFGALLAGAIIGDDVGTIFMVGGAIIGLYGLYEYLR